MPSADDTSHSFRSFRSFHTLLEFRANNRPKLTYPKNGPLLESFDLVFGRVYVNWGDGRILEYLGAFGETGRKISECVSSRQLRWVLPLYRKLSSEETSEGGSSPDHISQ